MFFSQQFIAVRIMLNPKIADYNIALSNNFNLNGTEDINIRQETPSPDEMPNLNGVWYGYNPQERRHGFCEITQEEDSSYLTFIDEIKDMSKGSFLDNNTIIANDWNGLIGHINGNTIYWNNNAWWVRQMHGDKPCIAGNYCGPGCSGPGAPVNPVDWCCKFHDDCYSEFGNPYPFPVCDKELVKCLNPLIGSYPLLVPFISIPFLYTVNIPIDAIPLKYPPWN